MPDGAANEAFARHAGPGGTRFGEIRWFAEIDSTNRYLLDAARAGTGSGIVAVADAQSAGRGRLGRQWIAPPGASLLVSVLLRPAGPVDDWPLMIAAAGVAAVSVVTEVCDLPAQLKWPNDVLVRDRKLAGLLAEADVASGTVVVGMGLNVAWADVPAELASIATAVSLEGGRVVERAVLLREWLLRFERTVVLLQRPGGVAWLRAAQRARSATLGRAVRVELADRHFEGRAVELALDGSLVVQTADGVSHTVAAGDVVHLRS